MLSSIPTFEKLYKKTSTGAIQEWRISIDYDPNDNPIIVSNFGQVGGKIQTSVESGIVGKNIGKKNETTPIQQAISQAKSTWKKQLKKGYCRSYEDGVNGVVDEIIEGGIFPMLAHTFSKQGHKIKYPALAQPKLDGHRCTSQNDDGSVSMWSRTRKPINSIPHIAKALEDKRLLIFGRFDGELYNHDYHDKFEELSSLIRQEKPAEGHENIQYHVYDIPNPKLTNVERATQLGLLGDMYNSDDFPIHFVETLVVNNEEELMDAFEHFLKQGYEGCMVRNMDGLYVNKRSYDLQKIKEFDDAEFKIVDVKVGTKGNMAGKAVFVCAMEDGNTFDCKMKGSLDELQKYAEQPELVFGKILTVQFQGMTKYGVPRFPVGLRFREDI